MSSKDSKSKEERLFEMFVKDYISETEFYRMLERIRNENKK